MKKITITALFVLILSFGILSVGTQAASVDTTNKNYGYMVPTNSTFEKTVSTVMLYGTNDYINFYIDSEYSNTYFFFEIYSDKNYEKLVYGDYCVCDSGTFTYSPIIKLKDNFKTGTYYCVTYAASVNGNGAKISLPSMVSFEIKVDRSPDYSKRVVILKDSVNTVNGPKITWNKLTSSTDKYYVYRRSVTGTTWTKVGTVNGKTYTFTDKSIKDKNGVYVYSVRGIDENGTTSRRHYAGIVAKFAAAPVVTSVKNTTDNKIEINWESSGASYYRIYKKTNDGAWELRMDLWTKKTFVDKDVVNGNTYQYRVQGVKNRNQVICESSLYGGKSVEFLAAPKLSSVKKAQNGYKVSWKKVDGATDYTVYRRAFDSTDSWKKLGVVSSGTLSFLDETAKKGVSYSYTVRSEKGDLIGSYSGKGLGYVVMDSPVNISCTIMSYDRLYINWDETTYATNYEVYMQNEDGKWELVKKTDENTEAVFDPGRTGVLSFKLRAVYKGYCFGEFTDVFKVKYYPEIDNFYSEIRENGNYFEWLSNSKADKYNIYRGVVSPDGSLSDYKLLTSVDSGETGKKLKYTDKTCEDYKTYKYEIKGLFGDTEQHNFKKVSLGRIPDNEITKKEKVKFVGCDLSNAIEIENIQEDAKVIVFGYNYQTKKWEKVDYGNVAFGIEIADYNLPEPNSKGEYKVSVVYSIDGKRTPIDSRVYTGSFKHGGHGDVTAKTVSSGIKFTWEDVKGAEKYIITCKDMNKETVKRYEVKNTGKEIYSIVLETDVYNNEFKLYAVDLLVYVDAVMDECRYNRKVATINAERTPVLYKAQSDKSGTITIYWDDHYSDGAYTIYRKAEGETSWKRIKYYDLDSKKTINGVKYNTYTDTTVKDGVKYTYTVKGNTSVVSSQDWSLDIDSHFDVKGVSAKSLHPTTMSSVTNGLTGVTVKWNKVKGASGYYIYRKTGSDNYKKIATIKDASKLTYVDKTVKSSNTYTYIVKAYSSTAVSSCTKSLSVKYLAVPEVTVKNTSNAILVKWDKISGAKGYYVYRKEIGDKKYTKIATIKSNSTVSYTDKKAEAGTTYYYKVKAYNGSAVSSTKASAEIKRLTMPELKTPVSSKSGITVKWEKVTGAEGYIVYRKTGSGSWVKLATVKGNSKVSYLDKTAEKGKTYSYSVKAYSGDSVSLRKSEGVKIKDKY